MRSTSTLAAYRYTKVYLGKTHPTREKRSTTERFLHLWQVLRTYTKFCPLTAKGKFKYND
jgi:hypothetical protein